MQRSRQLRHAPGESGRDLLARRAFLLLACGLVASSCTPSSGPAPSDADLIVRGTVLAGRTLEPLPHGAVAIAGGRIVAMGPASELVPGPRAQVVDVGDGFVVPALIDNHVHVLDRIEGHETDLARWLAGGVGTLVDCGSSFEGLAARHRGEATASWPRLLAAGPILTPPGGYPLLGSQDMPGLEVGDPAQAAAAARRLLDGGADLLKVAIDTGFTTDLDATDGWPVPEAATLEALAAVAHERGRTVRAHVTQSGEMERALDAGLDAAAHTPVDPLPEPLVARGVERGFILVTTAALWRETPELQAIVLDNLRRWVAAGGRIALGTDAPTFHPGWGAPRLELETLARGGIPAEAILKAATVWGAAAVGHGGELGSLEPGALADLIALPRDPRADPLALAESVLVVSRGRVLRQGPAVEVP